MKISRQDNVRAERVRRNERAKAPSDTNDDFALGKSGNSTNAAPISGAGPVAGIGALLSVQEVTDATAERSRGLRRGRELLEMLDQVRMGLLLGSIPESQLKRLVDILKAQRDGFQDPELEGTLREIETRAAVELAKFDRIRLET